MNQVQERPYSVSKGRKAINWWAELTILQALKEKGKTNWTREERTYYEVLSQRAMSWVTCACGNQCDIIPRDSGGHPHDGKLSYNGAKFYQDILALDIKSAISTLEKIEERSEELIKEITKANLLNNIN